MHTLIKKMRELKQLKEEPTSSSTTERNDDLPARRNRKTKATSRRRRTFMQELRERREAASSTETDDSSVELAAETRTIRQRSQPKKTARRSSPTPAKPSSEVAALEQEIRKLKCTQDQMEKYQLTLEKDYRKLQRQLLATDFSKQMTEMKNKELQEEMREIVEDQLRFDNRIKHGVQAMNQREQDYLGEIGLLQIENRILRQKSERCEQSLLESGQQSLLESRHQSLLDSIQQQPEMPIDDDRRGEVFVV